VIILELERDGLGLDDRVRFVGREYAEGFELWMPRREWGALGSPERVQFVVSERPLGVAGDVVRELRRGARWPG
jgi:hypothetical protein